MRKPLWAALAGVHYLLFRAGPAASSLFATGGFWFADENAAAPDIQFHLGFGSGIEAGIAKLKNAGVTLNSAYHAAALARHGAARFGRSGRSAADRSQLLGRSA